MPKIAYAQMKVTAGHPDVNTKKILQLISRARAGGAKVVIFPELAVSGKMLGDVWYQDTFIYECARCGEEIIAASKNIIVIFGNSYILEDEDDTFNAIFVAHNGKLIVKPLIKNMIIDDDEEYFIENPKGNQPFVNLKIGRKDYIVNFIIDMNIDHLNSDLVINFLTEPFMGEIGIIHKILNNHKCPIIQVGCVGIQNTGKVIHTFDGQSAVLNSCGKVVQATEYFEESLNFIELDEIDKMPVIDLPKVSKSARIYRALHYGVKEFLAQIGVNKVVIGVSGGIDSAVAAALYVQVLGADNVFLVNMPSRFNSATTKNLSEQLARNLGCKYLVVPIQESVDWTVKQLTEHGIEVSDFVKENIQARDRGSRILAAIAASLGGVFTCNANKAESTVGYATLYGDEAGFLSALADLWKFQVYALARCLNDEVYKREVIPQGIIDIVPSAELSTAQNVDEGKGDPLHYDYHDYLFRAFAEENRTPEEILRWYVSSSVEDNIGCKAGLVDKYFPTAQAFIEDLERWWKAFKGMGVAKRIQSPPIIAVSWFPYGLRKESQNGWHFTRAYLELKDRILAR